MDSFKRVTIPQEELGKKLSYDRALDVISYINGTSHANQDACAIKTEAEAAIADAAFTNDDDPFEVSANELDDLLSEIREPQKRISKRASKKPVASPAAA